MANAQSNNAPIHTLASATTATDGIVYYLYTGAEKGGLFSFQVTELISIYYICIFANVTHMNEDLNKLLDWMLNHRTVKTRNYSSIANLPIGYVGELFTTLLKKFPAYITKMQSTDEQHISIVENKKKEIQTFLNGGGFKEPTYTLELNKNVAELINQMQEARSQLPSVEPIDPEIIKLFDTSRITGRPQNITNIYINSMKSKQEIAELIFDKFRETNSRAGHIVMMRVFEHTVFHKLNPKEHDMLNDVINGLIDGGYIIYEKDSPECLRLTEKGFNYIYDDSVSITDDALIRKKVVPNSDFPESLYKDVLITLLNYGKDLEKKPRIYAGQSEEGLRDHFLTNLTGRYEKTSATGETFNKQGKTDIILKDDKGNNLFIAECKWWKGATVFHATIDQLFDNYITWRDTKVAIMFFVDNKDFTNVLEQIEAEGKKHKYYLEFLGKNNGTSFSFIFRQKDDAANKVQLEIMLFHFP